MPPKHAPKHAPLTCAPEAAAVLPGSVPLNMSPKYTAGGYLPLKHALKYMDDSLYSDIPLRINNGLSR